MSINDILDDKLLIPNLIILVLLVFTVKFVIFIFKKIKNYITNLYMATFFNKELNANITGDFFDTSNNNNDVTINFRNNSIFDILAIEFYVEEFNIYGQKIEFENELYFTLNKPIGSNCTKTFKYDTHSLETTKINLYFYSIYYNSNTYWGHKSASKKLILKKGYHITLNKNFKSNTKA